MYTFEDLIIAQNVYWKKENKGKLMRLFELTILFSKLTLGEYELISKLNIYISKTEEKHIINNFKALTRDKESERAYFKKLVKLL